MPVVRLPAPPVEAPTDKPDPTDKPQFIHSKRGKPKLVHQGFMYNMQHVLADGSKTWRCDLKDCNNCKATCRTKEEDGNIKVSDVKAHNHLPQPDRATSEQVRSDMKQQALDQPAAKIGKLLADSLKDVSKEAMPTIPTNDNLKRVAWFARKEDRSKRQRLGEGPEDANYKSLSTLVFDEALLRVGEESFLLYDDGKDMGDERIVIFGTKAMLEVMKDAEIWFADGTFKVAPSLWQQVYTGEAFVQGFTLPCFYALLPNKKGATYKRMWDIIFQLLGFEEDQQLPFIMQDFEKAALNALVKHVGLDNLGGCFFHFKQALHRHLQDLGLTPKYCNDVSFRVRVASLGALAFVPVEDVQRVYDQLEATFLPDEKPLLEYFSKTWIGAKPPGTLRAKQPARKNPLFPLKLWNCNARAKLGVHLTNNNAERFHNAFQTMFVHGNVHPSIPAFMDGLHAQQRLTENDLAKVKVGHEKHDSAAGKARCAKIKCLLDKFDEDTDGLKLVNAIAHLYLF